MSTVIEGGGPCYRTTTLPVSGQKTLPDHYPFQQQQDDLEKFKLTFWEKVKICRLDHTFF